MKPRSKFSGTPAWTFLIVGVSLVASFLEVKGITSYLGVKENVLWTLVMMGMCAINAVGLVVISEFLSALPRPRMDLVRWKKNLEGASLGYSECPACGDNFYWKKYHITYDSEETGCFPLCEECFVSMTPQQRLPHYRQLVCEVWDKPKRWRQIEAAVLAGK